MQIGEWASSLRCAPLLDKTAHDAEGVVDRAFAFVEDKLVAAHREDADRAPPVLHTCDLDNFCSIVVRLFHEVCVSKFILGECLNICDRFASKTLCEEVDLIAFHIFDCKDVEALEEGEGGIIYRVTQDGLLDEQNIAATFLDLFTYIEQVGAAFLDDLVHLPVIIDDNSVVHLGYSSVIAASRGKSATNIRLGSTELELNEANFSFFHSGRTASSDDDVLVKHNTIDEFGVFYRTANLLDDADIS
jgi:hypothetical protein